MNESLLSQYINTDKPSVYLQWDRINTAGVAFYEIQRSTHFDGNYEAIASVTWPQNEFIDTDGHPTYYYRIKEISVSGDILAVGKPIIGGELLQKSSVIFQIRHLQQIPIHDEEVIFARDRKSARLTFNNWAIQPKPEFRLQGVADDGDNSPYTVLSENESLYQTVSLEKDYPEGLRYKLDYQGKIYFVNDDDQPIAIHPYNDPILADYHVQLFTSSEINSALYMALQSINAQPGATKYQTVASAPFFYDAALICGASYYLLRQLLVSLNARERRLLLQDPENGSFDAISNLKDLVKEYGEEWKEFQKSLPKSRYPTTMSIITPEYVMPGGRSRFYRMMWKGGA